MKTRLGPETKDIANMAYYEIQTGGISGFQGLQFGLRFLRFTAFKLRFRASKLLNFTYEKLERFEQSTSLLQQPVVLTSSVLPCVLTHVQGTSELLFGDLRGGQEELRMERRQRSPGA